MNLFKCFLIIFFSLFGIQLLIWINPLQSESILNAFGTIASILISVIATYYAYVQGKESSQINKETFIQIEQLNERIKELERIQHAIYNLVPEVNRRIVSARTIDKTDHDTLDPFDWNSKKDSNK